LLTGIDKSQTSRSADFYQTIADFCSLRPFSGLAAEKPAGFLASTFPYDACAACAGTRLKNLLHQTIGSEDSELSLFRIRLDQAQRIHNIFMCIQTFKAY
jgi:hypothetical protein